MQKQSLITERLKEHINQLEDILELGKRVNFSRRNWSEYYIGHHYHVENKAIQASAVYLYQISSGRIKSTIGLSFNFIDESVGYEKQVKLPIEEQTIQFTYCLNIEKKNKQLIYSPPFKLEEAKSKFRELKLHLREKKEKVGRKLNIKEISVVFDFIFFSLDPKNETIIEKRAEELLTNLSTNIQKQKKSFIAAKNKVKTTRTKINREVKKSTEREEVDRLEKELAKAKENLEQLRKDKEAEYDLENLIQKQENEETDWITTKKEAPDEAEAILKEERIPYRYCHIINQLLSDK
ncbi:MAG: hypothetical protein CL760_12870 [Chloroflexi bacterium]|nr:hypothetical protein [Chloroflexota bacterium]|tara:strand:- start:50257 stop:51138 length:882 start_codon:yes stop_codon:yes gene_type:complete